MATSTDFEKLEDLLTEAGKAGLHNPRLFHTGRAYDPEAVNYMLKGKWGSTEQVVVMKVIRDASKGHVEAHYMEWLGGQLKDQVRAPKVIKVAWDKNPFYFIYEFVSGGRMFPRSMPQGRDAKEDPLTTPAEKRYAVDFYDEYRRAWAGLEKIPACPAESSAEFTKARINRWEAAAAKTGFLNQATLDRCKHVVQEILLPAMAGLPMQFQHGHFNNESVIVQGAPICLVDFDHCRYYPHGYDLAGMVWNLCWHNCWQMGISARIWMKEMEEWETAIGQQIPDALPSFRINMLERAVGSILADVGANVNRNEAERNWMLSLWADLLEHYRKSL
jgi:hypothetical protein